MSGSRLQLRLPSERYHSQLPLWVLLIVLNIPWTASAESDRARFFRVGDGVLHIKNMHTHMEVTAPLFTPDGSFDAEGLARIDRVFGLDSASSGDHISPRLLGMLDYFSDRVAPGKPIHLISGYRSPEYNSSLRDKGGNVARTSLHMDAMAIDFYIEGVSGKRLWEIVRSEDCCGVGHYGGQSIHLDAARPRFWEAATSKVRTAESDFNRRVYASTVFDRYRPGDSLSLRLTGISEFGFGVRPSVALVLDAEGERTAAGASLRPSQGTDCIWIGDRQASRSLSLDLPVEIQPGRYRLRLDFCRKPFEEMPAKTVSNEIEIRR